MARKTVNLENNPLFSGPTLASRQRSGSPYREIPLADIDIDPDQPRRVFNKESLGELATSIQEHGVLTPILVKVTDGGTYRLVAGERRYRASKLVGLETIPAVIDGKEEDTGTVLAKQLVENLQREDLTPMERAIAIGQLRENQGWSIREIATKLGVSKAMVQRSLEVLGLPEDLQGALIAGASESKILVLGQVKDEKARKSLLGKIEDLTRAALEKEVAAANSGEKAYHGGTANKPDSKKRKTLSLEDQRIVDDIQRVMGTKLDVLRNKSKDGQGKLVIEFYSNEDLQEVYKKLMA